MFDCQYIIEYSFRHRIIFLIWGSGNHAWQWNIHPLCRKWHNPAFKNIGGLWMGHGAQSRSGRGGASFEKTAAQGLVNVPIFGILDITQNSSHLVDHIPNGWVMWNMGTFIMTHSHWDEKTMVFPFRKVSLDCRAGCLQYCPLQSCPESPAGVPHPLTALMIVDWLWNREL